MKASTDHPLTYSPPPMTNPRTPSAAPVAWCRSDEFAQLAQGREYLLACSEQHPNCDMPLYAQPQANAAAPAADQAEGPSLADVDELCAEFGFHLDDDDHSLGILRDMVTAAFARWRAPVAEPVAAQDTEVDWKSMTARMDFGMAKPSKPAPVNLAAPHDPNFKPNFLRYEFSVYDENDQEVASGDADTFAEVATQGVHYFAQYMDDRLRVEFRCVQTMDCSKAIS